MNQLSSGGDDDLTRQILNFCRHVTGPHETVAVCQSDDYTLEVPTAKSTIEVLVILKGFQPRLLSYVKIIDGRNVVFLVVDQWIFERDVDRGFLGEALARLLLFPYTALDNPAYLHLQEVALKKRLILELLENLIISYPELSYTLRIKPEYFMYEVLLNRVRVFPPMAYGSSYILCEEANREKTSFILSGYMDALRQLHNDGPLTLSEHEVTISSSFITASKTPRVRFTNTIKTAPRAIFAAFFGVFPQLLNFLSQNFEAFVRFQTPPWKKEFDFSRNFVNPQKYVFVPTTDGVVSLADKVDIRDYAKRVLNDGKFSRIKVEEFGGFLNDVYLIRAYSDHTEKKVLVKRFKDLSGMKWFPLSMWSIGARSFALMGRSRLERECAINEFLGAAGFRVPKILHVSASERLVFMEFLEGDNFSNLIKRIALTQNSDLTENDFNIIQKVGETYAKVHALNVVLGDTKPENILVDTQGNLSLIDFEQASRSGDRAWDVACFLFYCGHYLPLNGGEQKAEFITEAFIEGYLQAGGNPQAIKCAAVTRYTRVFSIFTLPRVLRAMANTCRKIEGPKCKKW
ncbi:MAG: lipopolysaccharide kinase InaA family protein [Candidatus Bathyarchaeia archaeon]